MNSLFILSKAAFLKQLSLHLSLTTLQKKSFLHLPILLLHEENVREPQQNQHPKCANRRYNNKEHEDERHYMSHSQCQTK